MLAVIVVLVPALWVTVVPPYSNSPPIRSDGLGYYAWNDAIVTGNFGFCRWADQLDVVGALTARNHVHPGRCENKYPPGLALLRFPVMAPLAALGGGARTLAVSSAEERANQWLGVVALLTTVVLVAMTMRRLGVDALLADLLTILACFGTGLFHYGTYDASFTHVYTAALFGGLLYVGVRAADRGRRLRWSVVFALVLLIGLIRLPNLLVVLALAAAWLLWRVRGLAPKRCRSELVATALPVGAAIAIIVAFQLIYTHWTAGAWSLSSYGSGEPLEPGQLAELKVLFSYNHGLVLWYPVMALLLVISLLSRASRQWGYIAVTCVGLLTLLYGSWIPWFLGGAFGERGFVDVVPIVAVAGGLGISAQPQRARAVSIGAAAVCMLITLGLMRGYWSGALPFAGDTGREYWQQLASWRSSL